MELNWAELITQRNEWVKHNFPNDPPGCINSVLGCIEELGELCHAHLKEDQAIRGTPQEHQANAKDAVGDLAVYLMGVMNHYKAQPEAGPKPPETANGCLLKLAEAVGFMAGDHYNHVSSLTMRSNVSDVVTHLEAYCQLREWDFNEIVQTTWAAVKLRDWIKYPDTGLPQS